MWTQQHTPFPECSSLNENSLSSDLFRGQIFFCTTVRIGGFLFNCRLLFVPALASGLSLCPAIDGLVFGVFPFLVTAFLPPATFPDFFSSSQKVMKDPEAATLLSLPSPAFPWPHTPGTCCFASHFPSPCRSARPFPVKVRHDAVFFLFSHPSSPCYSYVRSFFEPHPLREKVLLDSGQDFLAVMVLPGPF